MYKLFSLNPNGVNDEFRFKKTHINKHNLKR